MMPSADDSAYFQLRFGLDGTIKQFFQSAGPDRFNRQKLYSVTRKTEIECPLEHDA